MDKEKLIRTIIQCVYNVRGILSPGYLEKVYHNALLIELQMAGLQTSSKVPITVLYKGYVVGDYEADIIVENTVILELKAVCSLNKEHEVQLVNYLTATGIDDGLLINFGSHEADNIKRKYRLYTPKKFGQFGNNY